MGATREMAEAAFDRLAHGAGRIEEVTVELVQAAVDCALAVAPQPASPADALPVPGAAVRALVAKWRPHPDARFDCARELESALRADGLAVELPTRDEIARSLYAAYEREAGRAGDDADAGMSTGYLAEADYVLGLLARRPATDAEHGAADPSVCAPRFQVSAYEWDCAGYDSRTTGDAALLAELNEVLLRRPATDAVRPVVCTTEQANRIACAAEKARNQSELADFINAELRPATDEAEALRTRRPKVVRVESGGLLSELSTARDLAAEREREQAERIADIESQLASVTESRDDARTSLAGCMETLKNLERQRDEALAKLAEWRTATGWDEPDQAKHMRAALAARPEPVAITPQFANRLADRFTKIANTGINPRYMYEALLAETGDRASVSVPQGPVQYTSLDHEAAVATCKSLDTGNTKLRAELDKANADLAACRVERDTWLGEHGRVSAELEESRKVIHEIADALGYVDWSDGGRFVQADDARVVAAAREAAGWQSSYEMYPELHEQYEALRAACEWRGVGIYPVESAIKRCEDHRDLDAAAYIRRVQAALIKALDARVDRG